MKYMTHENSVGKFFKLVKFRPRGSAATLPIMICRRNDVLTYGVPDA